MGLDIGKFKAEESRPSEGVWTDIGEGARIKVARIRNPKVRAFVREKQKPHVRAMRRGISTASLEEITMEAVARHVLLDWEGITEEERPVPYSWEQALQYFKQYPDFYELVVECAGDFDLFSEEDREDAEGNSEPTSSGSSGGVDT